MTMRTFQYVKTIGLSLLSLILLFCLLPRSISAANTNYFVKATGSGTTCSQAAPCSLVTAIGKAQISDTVYVASGTYTGTGSNVVMITKSIALLGGWNGAASGNVVRDPQTNISKLDGQKLRRVMLITGTITPTIDGFTIMNGNASNLIDGCKSINAGGCGGGILIYHSKALIANNIFTHNIALVTSTITYNRGYGGGLYLEDATGTVISGNLIISNTASQPADRAGDGGGIYLNSTGNHQIAVEYNRIISNYGSFNGGAIAFYGGGAYIVANQIEGNIADYGAGIYAWDAGASIVESRIAHNTGYSAIFLTYFGGGLYNDYIISNTTTLGVWILNGSRLGIGMTENIIGNNGPYQILAHVNSNSYPLTMTAYHNTIVGNGTGDGLRIDSGFVTAELVNNLFARSQYGVHNLFVTNTVSTEYIFYDSNISTAYATNIDTVTHVYVGNSSFINTAADDYHITLRSSARNKAFPTLLDTDIDYHPRLDGLADIGADEAEGAWLPIVLK